MIKDICSICYNDDFLGTVLDTKDVAEVFDILIKDMWNFDNRACEFLKKRIETHCGVKFLEVRGKNK